MGIDDLSGQRWIPFLEDVVNGIFQLKVQEGTLQFNFGQDDSGLFFYGFGLLPDESSLRAMARVMYTVDDSKATYEGDKEGIKILARYAHCLTDVKGIPERRMPAARFIAQSLLEE